MNTTILYDEHDYAAFASVILSQDGQHFAQCEALDFQFLSERQDTVDVRIHGEGELRAQSDSSLFLRIASKYAPEDYSKVQAVFLIMQKDSIDYGIRSTTIYEFFHGFESEMKLGMIGKWTSFMYVFQLYCNYYPDYRVNILPLRELWIQAGRDTLDFQSGSTAGMKYFDILGL